MKDAYANPPPIRPSIPIKLKCHNCRRRITEWYLIRLTSPNTQYVLQYCAKCFQTHNRSWLKFPTDSYYIQHITPPPNIPPYIPTRKSPFADVPQKPEQTYTPLPLLPISDSTMLGKMAKYINNTPLEDLIRIYHLPPNTTIQDIWKIING